ncbi:glucosamine inositolphosphorylceramide transferase family protein [Conexibacter arvalis]|uniref:Glucosamine inositolphosphorylceramide transferase 1 N-terminal domain-containing protein n=1 Tax=Conexibacter arvalis TaxID=912552 RepID=A0A840IAM3_9ACTN|nr:hypothetical protein [Conexibacter arvalis]MBB4661672.1 hypothetical protein [Conexibacter arvalis]
MPRRSLVVVLDGPPTPAWQARALELLDRSPRLTVATVRPLGPCRLPAAVRLRDRVEQRLFGAGEEALAPVRVAARDGGEAELTVWLAERTAPPDGAATLLFRHGGRIEPAEEAVRRALGDGAAVLDSELLLRRADGTDEVVEVTVSGLRPFSATLTRDLLLWKLAAVAARGAERAPARASGVGAARAGAPGSRASAPPPVSSTPPDSPPPSDAAPAPPPIVPATLGAWLRGPATRLLCVRPWSIRLRERGPEPTAGWAAAGDGLVCWGDSPVYADPFLFERDGRHHLFCEEVPAGAARGVISHTELRSDGRPAEPPTPVLAAPHHLSYPFVFAYGGELWMLPETSAARRVELYRATAFPYAWERAAVLLDDVDATDPTLLVHDGLLWLFAGVAARGASSLDELHLWWSERLSGPWRPHPRNPVVADVRGARPAGPVQRWGERLVRPGQDGSRRYGGALSFRAIETLTRSDYAEREVARLDPADLGDARAIHHYSADSRFEAVDLRRRELRVVRRARAVALPLRGRSLRPPLVFAGRPVDRKGADGR